MILADARYQRVDKRSKFPPWITQFIRESSQNLSADVAIDQIKTFLRQMGQPIEQEVLHSILLNETQVRTNTHMNNMSIYASNADEVAEGKLNNNTTTAAAAAVTNGIPKYNITAGVASTSQGVTGGEGVDGMDLELMYMLQTEEDLVNEANSGLANIMHAPRGVGMASLGVKMEVEVQHSGVLETREVNHNEKGSDTTVNPVVVEKVAKALKGESVFLFMDDEM